MKPSVFVFRDICIALFKFPYVHHLVRLNIVCCCADVFGNAYTISSQDRAHATQAWNRIHKEHFILKHRLETKEKCSVSPHKYSNLRISSSFLVFCVLCMRWGNRLHALSRNKVAKLLILLSEFLHVFGRIFAIMHFFVLWVESAIWDIRHTDIYSWPEIYMAQRLHDNYRMTTLVVPDLHQWSFFQN